MNRRMELLSNVGIKSAERAMNSFRFNSAAAQQIENLIFDHHVQIRRRFIGDDQARQ